MYVGKRYLLDLRYCDIPIINVGLRYNKRFTHLNYYLQSAVKPTYQFSLLLFSALSASSKVFQIHNLQVKRVREEKRP